MRAQRSRSLRSQVRKAIALVATFAVLLFGIPLAVAVDRLISSQTLAGLQRDATRGLATVPDNSLEAGSGVTAPASKGDTHIGVYDAQGALVAGRGPSHSPLAARAADGREHDGHEAGELSVVVPVLSDTTVAGSVRAGVQLSTLRLRVLEAWALLAALAVVVVAFALVLARRAAGRISAPFEQITSAARHLAEGRYQPSPPQWGSDEADAAGLALHESAQRIDGLLRQERAFIRDASHQLRTPLSAVLLHLEHQPAQVQEALTRARQLETTIDDLLSLRQLTSPGSCAADQVAAEAVRRWTRPDRPVTLRCDGSAQVALSEAALRQSLDVLLDNAIRHGSGPVTVTVEPFGDEVIVEVADQGPGFAEGAAPGTGLDLATRLVERAGGSLLVRRRAPAARVALLLPRTPSS